MTTWFYIQRIYNKDFLTTMTYQRRTI